MDARASKASKDRVAVGRHLRHVGHTLDHGLEIGGWSWYKVVSLKPERGRRPEKEACLQPVGASKEGVERETKVGSHRTVRPSPDTHVRERVAEKPAESRTGVDVDARDVVRPHR